MFANMQKCAVFLFCYVSGFLIGSKNNSLIRWCRKFVYNVQSFEYGRGEWRVYSRPK